MDARQGKMDRKIIGEAEYCFKKDIWNTPKRVILKNIGENWIVVVETIPVDTCRDILGYVNPIKQQVVAVEKKHYVARQKYEEVLESLKNG